MNFENPLVLVVCGIATVLIVALVFSRFFSEEARRERRRRKSNARVVSKSNRPTVRFSVNAKDERKD
jgi:peptidoglycan/LPS O-acetylase OafA/YrhL